MGFSFFPFISVFLTAYFFTKHLVKQLEQIEEEATLKTELINWIVKEGRFMDEDEFERELIIKIRFINLVTD